MDACEHTRSYSLLDFSLRHVSIGDLLLYMSDSCMILIQVCSVYTCPFQAMVSSKALLTQGASRFLFYLLIFPLAISSILVISKYVSSPWKGKKGRGK